MRRTRRKSGESGTQLLELAVVMPLLLFLALAVAEGAGVIRTHQILNNAAREGANLATRPEHSGATNDIRTHVVRYAELNGVNLAADDVQIVQDRTVITSGGTAIRASEVQVTHAYQLQFMPRLPLFNRDGTVMLVGSAEFRNLY